MSPKNFLRSASHTVGQLRALVREAELEPGRHTVVAQIQYVDEIYFKISWLELWHTGRDNFPAANWGRDDKPVLTVGGIKTQAGEPKVYKLLDSALKDLRAAFDEDVSIDLRVFAGDDDQITKRKQRRQRSTG